MADELEREMQKQRLWDEYYALETTNIDPSAFPSYEDCLRRRAEIEIRKRQILDAVVDF